MKNRKIRKKINQKKKLRKHGQTRNQRRLLRKSFALGLFFNTERPWFTIDAPGYSTNHKINKLLQKQSEILYKCIAKTNYYSESIQQIGKELVKK